MSNAADIDEREDRGAALERFAATTRDDDGGGRDVMIPPQVFSGVDRAMGAMKVAVYRDEARVLASLKALAAAAGEDWYYRFPVRNKAKGTQDWIEGPSIKLANDLARIYGNCDVDCRMVDLGDRWLFYARFQDFETGFTLTRPFIARKNSSKIGGSDDDRRLDIAFQVGVSKAQRNVVVNALQTHASFAFEEAKQSLIEKIGNRLDTYRTKAIARLQESGVDLKRVERTRGRVAAEWIATDVAAIIANIKAVQDGMATWDDTFPPLDQPANTETVTEAEVVGETRPSPAQATRKVDDFAAGGAKPAQAAATAAAPAAPAVEEKPAPAAKVVQQPVEKVAAGESQAPASTQAAGPSGPAAASAGGGGAAPGAPAAASASGGAPASDEQAATAADIKHLVEYASALATRMTATSLQRVGWPGAEWPAEGTALGLAVARVYETHLARVQGAQSPVDVQNAVKKIVATLS